MPTITLQGQRIPYRIVRTKRARYVRLTITMWKGLRVSAPSRYPKQHLVPLIHERSDWVLEKLKEFKRLERKVQHIRYRTGSKILFLGREYTLKLQQSSSGKSRIRIVQHELEVSLTNKVHGDERVDDIRRLLTAWYRVQAERIILTRVETLARRMRVSPRRVTIKKLRSRWGSCSEQGNLNFNLRLMLVPPRVLNYVLIHELAHLRELNHSDRYWRIVDRYCPQRVHIQQWLKEHSHLLDF